MRKERKRFEKHERGEAKKGEKRGAFPRQSSSNVTGGNHDTVNTKGDQRRAEWLGSIKETHGLWVQATVFIYSF